MSWETKNRRYNYSGVAGVEEAGMVPLAGGPLGASFGFHLEKPDPRGKDIIPRESLGTDEQQLYKISH